MPMITKRSRGLFRRRSATSRGAVPPSTKTWSLVAALSLALAVSGCSSSAGAEPSWEVELPFSQVDVVAVVDDAVFCLGSDAELSYGSAPCRMVVYSSSSGAERFHTILDLRALGGYDGGRANGAFVLLVGKTAVVISASGRLRGFDATSGREIWSAEDVGEVFGSGDGYVFAADGSSRLAAYDARTGSRSAVDTSLSWKQQISTYASAVAARGRLFVATGESLCAVDVPSWRERWVQPFESDRSDLQVASGCVIATSRRGWEVFDAETGASLWRFEAYETNRPMPPTVVGEMLFTMRGRSSNSELEDGYLRVYDLKTGVLRTRFAMAPLPEPDGIVAAGGRLYLASTEPHYGTLRRSLVAEELAKSLDCRPSAVDCATGLTVWTGEPASWGSLTRPSVSDDGFVAVAAMTPRRNRPAKLMAYRPVFSK